MVNFEYDGYKKISELIKKFGLLWNLGETSTSEGIQLFNNIINILSKNSPLTVREIVKWFCIENSDLVGLTISKLKSYLDLENKILYSKKR